MKCIYCLLMLLQPFIVNAQTLNETAYFILDKSTGYQSFNDTLHIEGILLNPEQRSLSCLSNYCYVEIMDKTAKILDRIKIRCHDSHFTCSFPLDSISTKGNYFVRVYTRYMQNFSPSVYPIQVFSVGTPQNVFIPADTHALFPFQLRYKNGILLYKLNKAESNKAYDLTIAAEDGSMETLSLAEHPESCLKITNGTSLNLLNCFVTDISTDSIVFQQYIPIHENEDSLQMILTDSTGYVNDSIAITLAKSNYSSHVLAYIIHKEDRFYQYLLSKQLNRPPSVKSSVYRQMIKGNFYPRFLPEQVLSISGNVKKEYAGPLKSGIITAFDSQQGYHYDSDIKADGSFIMGVDDYPVGTTFYLQAFNGKGKSNYYEITLDTDIFPDLYLPPLHGKPTISKDMQTSIDTTDIHWIPEVMVKARSIKKTPPSTSKFFKNRYFEAKDLEQSSYTDLRPIFEQMIGIRIVYTEEGEPYLISTRGSSLFEKEEEKKEEEKEDGTGASRQGIRIRIDGIWDDRKDLFHLVNVSDIASIEYIPPSRANIYGPGNMMGAIDIKTKSASKGHYSAKALGILYEPFGLTYPTEKKEIWGITSINIKKGEETKFLLKLPSIPGSYQIIIEGIKENGTLVFISRNIEIEDPT
ncbi:hypothetical protein [Phocaeicola sp.]